MILFCAATSTSALVFAGTGTGAIADGPAGPCNSGLGTPLDVSFAIAGVSGGLQAVELTVSITHRNVGDLNATLIAPDNTQIVLFSNTGWDGVNSACGDNSNLLAPTLSKTTPAVTGGQRPQLN